MHHLKRAQFATADADAKILPSLVQRTSLIPAMMCRKVLKSLQRHAEAKHKKPAVWCWS